MKIDDMLLEIDSIFMKASCNKVSKPLLANALKLKVHTVAESKHPQGRYRYNAEQRAYVNGYVGAWYRSLELNELEPVRGTTAIVWRNSNYVYSE